VSVLHGRAEQYVAMRRSLGYKFHSQARMLADCWPALRMSTKSALMVRTSGCGKTPPAGAGRGLGVQVAGLVFSLP